MGFLSKADSTARPSFRASVESRLFLILFSIELPFRAPEDLRAAPILAFLCYRPPFPAGFFNFGYSMRLWTCLLLNKGGLFCLLLELCPCPYCPKNGPPAFGFKPSYLNSSCGRGAELEGGPADGTRSERAGLLEFAAGVNPSPLCERYKGFEDPTFT